MTSMTGQPAYVQVTAELRRQIASGELAPGGKLPSMSELCRVYGVSNTVIRDALNELRRDGLVVGQQGKGVYVRDDAQQATASRADLATRVDELSTALATLAERVATLEAAGR
jgi:DNA-binding GntR family transcriptional regulator